MPTPRAAAFASSVSCLPTHMRFGLFLIQEAIFSHSICLLFILLILLKCSHLSLTFVKMASPHHDFANSLIGRLAKSQELPLQFRDSASRRQDSVQAGFSQIPQFVQVPLRAGTASACSLQPPGSFQGREIPRLPTLYSVKPQKYRHCVTGQQDFLGKCWRPRIFIRAGDVKVNSILRAHIT